MDQADLQAQIVTLRLRLDQLADSQAAIIEHLVKREVGMIAGRIPRHEHLEWLEKAIESDKTRKRAFGDMFMHAAKMGLTATLAFLAMSAWELIKIKLGK